MSKKDAAVYLDAAKLIGNGLRRGFDSRIGLATLAIRDVSEFREPCPERERFIEVFDSSFLWDDDACTALCFAAAMAEAGDL